MSIKEKPIIFKEEMVRAILESRKTQTRRLIKPQPTLSESTGFNWKGWAYGIGSDYKGTQRNFVKHGSPYGKIGDRLWVRETWFQEGELGFRTGCEPDDESARHWLGSEKVYYANEGYEDNKSLRKRPSIHMPRWASRITLEITNIRVERVQDISEQDAIANGFDDSQTEAAYAIGWYERPVKAYRRQWELINGQGSWDLNQWVWVINFKVLSTSKKGVKNAAN